MALVVLGEQINFTTNTSSSEYTFSGGLGSIDVGGTMGGATVKLEFRHSTDDSWQEFSTDTTFTAAGRKSFTYGACFMRVTVSSGSSHDIDVTLSGAITSDRAQPFKLNS